MGRNAGHGDGTSTGPDRIGHQSGPPRGADRTRQTGHHGHQRGPGREPDRIGHDGDQNPSLRGSRPRPRLGPATAVGLMLLVLLAAACGSSPKSPGVAGIGPSTTTKATGSGGGSRGGSLPQDALAEMTAYSKCMRSHGILDFPDPTPNPGGPGGGFELKGGPGSDLDPNNPTYQAANKTCQPLLPNGGRMPPPTAQYMAAAVKLAACMRTHGFPNFSDPNGQGVFVLHNVNRDSQFQSTMSTCRSLSKFDGPMRVAISNQGP